MEISPQQINSDRPQYAAGRFYPADNNKLNEELSGLFEKCTRISTDGIAWAIIVPHAGYVFSGETAASAYLTTVSTGVYENIFIIGSTHIARFDGASVYGSGDYITPFGNAAVNKDIAGILKTNEVFNASESFHLNDHNIEVQIPLIQYYFKDSPGIVPVIIGTDNIEMISNMAEILKPWFNGKNLFIISSDFSHYPSYEDALLLDSLTAEALMSGNKRIFLETLRKNESGNVNDLATSMCAWTSGLLLLNLIKDEPELEFRKITYCNSGDSPYGNKDSVVGYNAIGLYDNNIKANSKLSFNETEKEILFSIARNAIESGLKGKMDPETDITQIPEILEKKYGAFVTLKINGELRGCIGRFVSNDPLYKAVTLSAISSAFEDPRFEPLTEKEYKQIDVEITVLGPLESISDKKEIILGKHGIYIKKGSRAGTMLPQVATENRWSVEEFLEYTSEYKVGIGRDGWKDAELYVYEGLVLEEK